MKIESVQTFPVRLPLTKPVVMSHTTITASPNVLVKVTTDEGVVGWGEGVAAPTLTGDTQQRIEAGIRFLGEVLVGRDPMRRVELWNAMRHRLHGNATSLGALDMALHDIAGKVHGVPVVELLGGRQRDSVPALSLIGSGDPDADTRTALERAEAGNRWFKLKLGIADPDTEVKTFRSLRQALGPDVVLCGDVNQGWSEPVAVRFFHELEGLDVAFVEQPTTRSDPDGLIRVARASPVPICADESVSSFDDIMRFARTGVAGVSLKAVKLGGITGLMRGAALCEMFGLSVNLAGITAESSVAAAANVHAAAAMERIDFGCSPANQVLVGDVSVAPLRTVDGSFPVPEAPGLGVEVDEDLVLELAGS